MDLAKENQRESVRQVGAHYKPIEALSFHRLNAVGKRLGCVKRQNALDQIHLVLRLMDTGFRYTGAARFTWDRVNLDERTM